MIYLKLKGSLHYYMYKTELLNFDVAESAKLLPRGRSVFILMQPSAKVAVIVHKVQIALHLSLNLMVKQINE